VTTILTPADLLLVPKLRSLDVQFPVYTLRAAKQTGVPIALAASILRQETDGGHNEWGHDPTIFIGGYDAKHAKHWGEEPVTKAAYLAYKLQRGKTGEGGMQGVGPCQLTWYALQDAADAAGGCWKPYPNMLVGFGHLAQLIKRNGFRIGIAAYNGDGPAAQAYANIVISRALTYAAYLNRPVEGLK